MYLEVFINHKVLGSEVLKLLKEKTETVEVSLSFTFLTLFAKYNVEVVIFMEK